jgi:hypothetical protein
MNTEHELSIFQDKAKPERSKNDGVDIGLIVQPSDAPSLASGHSPCERASSSKFSGEELHVRKTQLKGRKRFSADLAGMQEETSSFEVQGLSVQGTFNIICLPGGHVCP